MLNQSEINSLVWKPTSPKLFKTGTYGCSFVEIGNNSNVMLGLHTFQVSVCMVNASYSNAEEARWSKQIHADTTVNICQTMKFWLYDLYYSYAVYIAQSMQKRENILLRVSVYDCPCAVPLL